MRNYQWLLMLFGITRCTSQINSPPVNKDQPLVLILGAGTAGISTAKRLVERGHTNFKIIEGSDRVGGRVLDMPLGDYRVEVGAPWIQSLNKNPVYILSRKYNLSQVLVDYDDNIILDEDGRNVSSDAATPYEIFEAALEDAEYIADDLRSKNKPDSSKRAYFTLEDWLPSEPIHDIIEVYDHDFEFASPPELCSAKYCNMDTFRFHESEEDSLVTDKRGFSHLLMSLISEIMNKGDDRLILQQVVEAIEHNDTKVIVRTTDGNRYIGDYVVVTFSIGVLQNWLVEFNPLLPLWKEEAITQKGMGHISNHYFQFDEHFWSDDEYILYASKRRGYYPIWQNMDKSIPGSRTLQLTVTGEESRRIDRLTNDEIIAEVVEVLGKMYPNASVTKPIGSAIKRWGTDPLFMGGKSVWSAGYSLESQAALKAPVGRVYYAGEAMDEGHDGYIQGAFYSGRNTADDLVKCMTSGICRTFTPSYLARGCTYADAVNYNESASEDDGTCLFGSTTSTPNSNKCKSGKPHSAAKTFSPALLQIIMTLSICTILFV